jgi:pimeloyl-ACP methyl ester carboxylesterase
MESNYNEEIIYTTSEDGFLLEGVLIRPVDGTIHPIGVVCVHGNAGRFYDYPYVTIGRALAKQGLTFVSANTRGHDISAFMWRSSGGKPTPWNAPDGMPTGAGSAWEHLDESPRDLAAWIDVVANRGISTIVLMGHSSGAQRTVLYQAERQDARVAGIVLASPDLRGFMPSGELEEAQRMVAAGQGMDVLPAQPYAPWYRQRAQTVVDKAAILSRLLISGDGEPTIVAIHCPVLAFFGSNERGTEDMLHTIQQQARAANVSTCLIDGADHIYSAHETDVADAITQWAAVLA